MAFSCINGRNEDFVNLEDKIKFVFILASNDGHVIKAAGTYIAQCFKKRNENVNAIN